MKESIICSILVASLLLPGTHHAQVSGELDVSFAGSGVLIHDESGHDSFSDVAIQPDGKIILVGKVDFGGAFLMVRLDESGSLDPTFGSGGVVTTGFGEFNDENEAESVVLQPDGRILVAGRSGQYGDTAITVCRYSQSGELEAAFGTGGCALIAPGGSHNWGKAIALLPDGAIMVAGSSELASFDVVLMRLTSSGALDSGFDGDGIVTFDVGGSTDYVEDMAVDGTTGAMVVVGRTLVTGNYDFFTARFSAAGGPDPAFDDDGVVVASFGSFDTPSEVLSIEGPRYLVAGWGNGGVDLILLSYSDDGSLDSEFGSGGSVVLQQADGGFAANALARAPDGTLFTAGQGWNGNDDDVKVAAFEANGGLISSFGVDGIVTLDNGLTDIALAAELDRSGRLVVAGSSTVLDSDVLCARFEALDGEIVFWDDFEHGSVGYWSGSAPSLDRSTVFPGLQR